MRRFKHALSGGRILLCKDINFLLHLTAGLIVFILGFTLKISMLEWLFISIAVFLVWLAEAINTAIEYAVDLSTTSYHTYAKYAKDIAAFSVLLAALLALIIGSIVFIPKIL
ncbi:diacylglycerol kinase family protein [Staphylococcus sp. 17KM0847]|uniref:diacylglycerol kinase family protein n=1 Tax=Staphylococcus sp. 17KM0847 TaxID=2583989 RepID=UPI0015DCE30B|nr:diacylglycerol kinase family protein [Staphylococcus sp. 17KM0847]QLK86965.1 diacylglycerol kinase family protein [Staphylococcus sp. 17KM0847]